MKFASRLISPLLVTSTMLLFVLFVFEKPHSLQQSIRVATLSASTASVRVYDEDGTSTSTSEVKSEKLMESPKQLAERASSAATTTTATIAEYELPVSPLLLLFDQLGKLWFTSFYGAQNFNSTIGQVDLVTNQVVTYKHDSGGNIWGVSADSSGNLWYSVVNEDYIGKLDTSANTFTEWAIPSTHFGIEVDKTSGEVWFTTFDVNSGIAKLSPTSNIVSSWQTVPYTNIFDLGIAPNGDIWITIQPSGLQALGRFTPATNRMTVWAMPFEQSRPFRLSIESSDSIWFTEIATQTNSIAHLTPSNNFLQEYKILTDESMPWELLNNGNQVWFSESATAKIGKLDLALATSTATTLIAVDYTLPKNEFEIIPTVISAVPVVSPTIVTMRIIPSVETDAFTELLLEDLTASPAGLALAPDQTAIWFAESDLNRIGRFTFPIASTNQVFLPLVFRNE